MSELSNTAINLLAEYTQDIRNAHKPSADLKLYIAALEAKLEATRAALWQIEFESMEPLIKDIAHEVLAAAQ